MSIEALRWALEEGEARELEPGQRHVLLILGNRADERGFCYPSVSWICRRTGMKRRTVQVHMKALEDLGVLRRDERVAEHGGRTSDAIWLGLRQPGLPLPDPRADFALGGAENQQAPAQHPHPPRADPAPNTQDKKKEKKGGAGHGKPSPVAALFKVYQDGIRRLYGAEYPPSAKANGQLAGVVKTLGAAPAARSLDFYLARQKPYYATRKHALDVFVKDASDLWIEAQQATGGSAARPAPVKAIAYLEHYDGDGPVRMAEYPAGDPLDIAKAFAREYASKVERTSVSCVMIRQGAAERRYKPEELR